MQHRLETIEAKIDGLRDGLNDEIDRGNAALDDKIDRASKIPIGWMLAQTAAIVVSIVAVAFASHR